MDTAARSFQLNLLEQQTEWKQLRLTSLLAALLFHFTSIHLRVHRPSMSLQLQVQIFYLLGLFHRLKTSFHQ